MSERKILAYFILHIAGKTYSFLFFNFFLFNKRVYFYYLLGTSNMI